MSSTDSPRWPDLAEFIANNPQCRVRESGDTCWVVERPWGDSTLELHTSGADTELTEALNALILPQRLTALYHRDTQILEVIWTADPVRPEFYTRAFTFRFRCGTHQCRFDNSSARLLTIAKRARPVAAASDTGHRNLESYLMYLHHRDTHPETRLAREGRPVSFWVDSVTWNEQAVVELCEHLNFYMSYFDRRTPVILIHEADPPPEEPAALRFPYKVFPADITGRPVHAHLLHLWSAAFRGNAFVRFIYGFQILEYAAFYYIHSELLDSIKRILMDPAHSLRPDECVRDIVDLFNDDRTQKDHRLQHVLRKYVPVQDLWSVVEANSAFFAQPTEFSGGFAVPSSIIRKGCGLQDFASQQWDQQVGNAFKSIRNALVHPRESRNAGTILPSRSNQNRLRPWLDLILVAAAHVIARTDHPSPATADETSARSMSTGLLGFRTSPLGPATEDSSRQASHSRCCDADVSGSESPVRPVDPDNP